METAVVAEIVRERSRAGELLALADLETELAGRHLLPADATTEPVVFSTLIAETMSNHPDIKQLGDDANHAWYFSEQFMTGAYARMLLLKGRGPLNLMAEVIREHSRVYPQPVPITLFQAAPFHLRDDELSVCLQEMAGQSAYQDIACLTTSIGNSFVYSTDHLEPGYAAMLAEWADVGQIENP